MAVLGVLVFFAAIAGNLVSAEEPVGFAENLRGSRIVSGWEAEEGQIKWQLSIRMVAAVGTVSACGASIVHNEWAITAAHCTALRTTIVIRGGVTHLTRPEILFETTEYYNHPLYNENIPGLVQPNDIGLLKFNRFVPFSDLIQPINVQLSADKDRNYNGVLLMASGWGLTWTGGSSPQTLNWVYLVGDSNLSCFIIYGGNSVIQDSTLCASAYNITSQSTCQGDSGGPLVTFEDDGAPTLVGVASFVSGSGCHVNMPAGFIRPGHYHQWYFDVTGIDFDQRRPPPTLPPTTLPPTTLPPTTEFPIDTEKPTPEPPSSESSETDPGSSEADAGSSEADSGSSDGNGGSSEGNGGSSEGNGGSSEGNGGSSEGNGGSSEGNGGSSEGNGGSSEGNGGSSEGNGGSSGGNGGSSEDNAGSSGADSETNSEADSGANLDADSESNDLDNDDLTFRDGFRTQWFQRNARH